MKKVFTLSVLFISLLLTACAEMIHTSHPALDKRLKYIVLPFVNYTETPKAGFKAQSITSGVLGSKGYKVSTLYFQEEEITSEKGLKNLLKKLPSDIDIIVEGYVNEWRYKTGIDGEPAVSIAIKFLDARTMETLHFAVLSKSGMAYESIGVVAQKLISEIVR